MYIKALMKGASKVSPTIKFVKPNVGKSKLKKAVDDVKLESKKMKGKMKRSFQKIEEDIDPARKKLRQTTQKLKGEKITESGVSKGKDLREKKMGGGMMGRRFGMKAGTLKPKTNVQKIKETFAPKKKLSEKQMKIAKLAGDPKKIDARDLAKLRGRG